MPYIRQIIFIFGDDNEDLADALHVVVLALLHVAMHHVVVLALLHVAVHLLVPHHLLKERTKSVNNIRHQFVPRCKHFPPRL
jgi:hypothetical protein